METYITTKIVKAEPRHQYGEDGYKIEYPDGYTSWCPKDEFERTARPISESETGMIAGRR